jgi:hypothetical protein
MVVARFAAQRHLGAERRLAVQPDVGFPVATRKDGVLSEALAVQAEHPGAQAGGAQRHVGILRGVVDREDPTPAAVALPGGGAARCRLVKEKGAREQPLVASVACHRRSILRRRQEQKAAGTSSTVARGSSRVSVPRSDADAGGRSAATDTPGTGTTTAARTASHGTRTGPRTDDAGISQTEL